jgi:hypothetical protein
MRIQIPVKGGMLELIESGGKLWCEYNGVLSRELALELVKATPDTGMMINGMSLREYMEELFGTPEVWGHDVNDDDRE